ncbi:MAG: hypothetical protein AB8H79_18120 [Myxococcota bacterium]
MTRLHVLLLLSLPLATIPAMACGMEVEDDSISLESLMQDIEDVAVAVAEPVLNAVEATAAPTVEAEAAEIHDEGQTLAEANAQAQASVEAASLRPVAGS